MNRIRAITSAALFAAIHVIFTVLSRFIPGIELILVIFLPLASAIYVLKNDNVGTAAFVIATFLICILFEPVATLLYTFPAIIVGTCYGILAKHKTKQDVTILVTILAELLGLFVSVIAIKAFFPEQNLIETIQEFLHLTKHQTLYLLPILAIVIAICQAIAVHTTLKSELRKLGYESPTFDHFSKLFFFVFPALVAIGIGFSFFYIPASITGLVLSLLCAVPIAIEGYKLTRGKLLYICLGIQGVLLIGGVLPLLNVLPNLYLGYLPLIFFLPILLTSYIKSF